MENIEYLIQKLKKVNPAKAKEFSEEYDHALNIEDIMQNKMVSETALIALEAKLEFELMFSKG